MIRTILKAFGLALLCLFVCSLSETVSAQNSAASISGTVTDPTGAVVPKATVEITQPRQPIRSELTTTDTNGIFNFANVPFNPYHT